MTAIIGGFNGKTHVLVDEFDYVPGGTESIQIKQDQVNKEFIFVVDGNVTATFAGGVSPRVNPYGVSHGIFESIELSRKGSDKFRSYRGLRQLAVTMERQFAEAEGSIYKANSADLAGYTGIKQGLMEISPTTQSTAFRESFSMMFENKLSGAWYPTLFSTKDLTTATLNFKFGQLKAIQDPTDPLSATYTGNIKIKVYASCCDYMLNIDPKESQLGAADWNQTYEDLSFSGIQKGNKHQISPEGMLQGMLITGSHSNGKPFDFENMKNTYLEIKYGGITIAEGSLADFLEIDNNKTMLTKRKMGSAYLSFLNNSAFNSGLYIANGKKLDLVVTTDQTLTYSPAPVILTFEYDQIIFDPTKQVKVG